MDQQASALPIAPPLTPRATGSPLARRARLAAARRRAWTARRASTGPGHDPAHAAPVAPGISRTPARTLTAEEFDRRLEHVARVLVRTIRAVPMPGVSPFTRRDWAKVVGIVVAEALIVVVLVAGAQR
jgi:hypothetical protein